MRFAHPQMLWLLLAVPAAVIGYGLAFGVRRRRLARLGDAPLVAKMSAGGVGGAQAAARGADRGRVAALVLALARPQGRDRPGPPKQRGLDLVVALDFSRSMLAKDVYPSRLERAKRELGELLDLSGGRSRRHGRVRGRDADLPAHHRLRGGEAVLARPQSLGHAGGRHGHRARDPRRRWIELVPLRAKEATAGAQRGQAILLLTDGEDTESEPLEAADEASKLGVKIFTVGIGSRSGELIPEYDDEGKVTGYVKDADGKYVTSRLGRGHAGARSRSARAASCSTPTPSGSGSRTWRARWRR